MMSARGNYISQSSVDFVIVTALDEERTAVLANLPGAKKLPPNEEDVRTYYRAELSVQSPDGEPVSYSIVVLSLLDMGRTEATTAVSDAIRRWRPRCVLLAGIAAGLKAAGVSLGDVLIASKVFDYEQQKLEKKGDSIRPEYHRVDPRLLDAAKNLQESLWLGLITARRPDKQKPKRVVGVVASGDKILACSAAWKKLLRIDPKLIGAEMEAGGAARACFEAAKQPAFFMVRGVSDLGDENKDSKKVKVWRSYACDVAAAYLIGLLRSSPLTPSQKTPLLLSKRVAQNSTPPRGVNRKIWTMVTDILTDKPATTAALVSLLPGFSSYRKANVHAGIQAACHNLKVDDVRTLHQFENLEIFLDLLDDFQKVWLSQIKLVEQPRRTDVMCAFSATVDAFRKRSNPNEKARSKGRDANSHE
jgi:nucleoside phosphorylase